MPLPLVLGNVDPVLGNVLELLPVVGMPDEPPPKVEGEYPPGEVAPPLVEGRSKPPEAPPLPPVSMLPPVPNRPLPLLPVVPRKPPLAPLEPGVAEFGEVDDDAGGGRAPLRGIA